MAVVEKQPDTPGALKARALRLLARREHSRAELARKLAPHAGSHEVLASILDELVLKRQLSDARYAEQRAHELSRRFGTARIRHELKAKGIPDHVVRSIPAGDELLRARAILTRRYAEPAATREERARRSRFLQGRGFQLDIIRKLLDPDESSQG